MNVNSKNLLKEKPSFVSEYVDWSKEKPEWKKSFIEIGEAIQKYDKENGYNIKKFVVCNSQFTDYKIELKAYSLENVSELFKALEKAGWKVSNFNLDRTTKDYQILMTIWV